MRTKTWILGVVVAVTFALAVFSTEQRTLAAASPAADIKIDNFSFAPATLTVKAGTPITWTNGDDIPHTIVSEDHSFKSKVLDTGDKFTFTPSRPGTYSYFCSIHPKMTGKLVVE